MFECCLFPERVEWHLPGEVLPAGHSPFKFLVGQNRLGWVGQFGMSCLAGAVLKGFVDNTGVTATDHHDTPCLP